MKASLPFSAVASIGVVLCAAAIPGHPSVGTSPAADTALQDARQTFLARCSTCHAENGEGSEVGASLNVPDLRSVAIQRQDDATLRRIIQNGRGDMPTFRRDFSDPEIDQLIRLVRSFAQTAPHR